MMDTIDAINNAAIWSIWLTCCIVTVPGCIIIAMVTFFNFRQLSRPTLLSLNVVVVSSLTVFLNGWILVGIQQQILCKLCRVMIQYLVMALPGTAVALNLYCFIWTRYPDIDNRRVTSCVVVAFALSPHVVSVLVNTGLLASSFVEIVTTESSCYWAKAKRLHKLVMMSFDTFIPCILNTIIVFVLITNCITLYQKSKRQEGAMREAMLRRVNVSLTVALLNILQLVLIEPAKSEPVLGTANYHTLYIMYLLGHAVTVLWWLFLLPDARTSLGTSFTAACFMVFKHPDADVSGSSSAPLTSPTDVRIHLDNGEAKPIPGKNTAVCQQMKNQAPESSGSKQLLDKKVEEAPPTGLYSVLQQPDRWKIPPFHRSADNITTKCVSPTKPFKKSYSYNY